MIVNIISERLNINSERVKAVLKLLSEDATIPFIARYRKEMTGGLDEVKIAEISDLNDELNKLEQRKQGILEELKRQGIDNEGLLKTIDESWNFQEIEDLYLPYKPKRKTRAVKAKELGLEPLAKMIMKQQGCPLFSMVDRFIKGDVKTEEDALQGARDIISEWISENQKSRGITRRAFEIRAAIKSKKVKTDKEGAEKFESYFDWEEKLSKCPSHRFLAMCRGEDEGFLKIKIVVDNDDLNERLSRVFVKGNNELSEQVELALKDSIKRLLLPSFETEFRNIYKKKSDEDAIKVFAQNLRQLLLASPLGNKRILAIDPGFRTGCKVVCLDEYGNLKHNETIYPHPPKKETSRAMNKISSLVNAYKIEAIAIGNGTAGRETESFIKRMRFDRDVSVFIVNEAGASIYSASSVAREEFPNYDVTVRGAVSIGRRLSDPMAELVKIDPKSIGVGQYQHDVDQRQLKESLDREVQFCVNHVGVNLNTASEYLLAHISGLNKSIAKNIVEYRSENGAFENRNQLKKVPRLGAKAFEQAAGFLRIREGANPLDNSSVHPESYTIAKEMISSINGEIENVIGDDDLLESIELEKFVNDKVGLPTLQDIIKELKKPGRDPRTAAKVVEFDKNIKSIDDLHAGMELPGVVTNITNFGAFVDVGAKQDGLVHISEIRDEYISNPADVLKLNQPIRVKVLSIDSKKKRVAFSMKGIDQPK